MQTVFAHLSDKKKIVRFFFFHFRSKLNTSMIRQKLFIVFLSSSYVFLRENSLFRFYEIKFEPQTSWIYFAEPLRPNRFERTTSASFSAGTYAEDVYSNSMFLLGGLFKILLTYISPE